jgi:hypothetical protein
MSKSQGPLKGGILGTGVQCEAGELIEKALRTHLHQVSRIEGSVNDIINTLDSLYETMGKNAAAMDKVYQDRKVAVEREMAALTKLIGSLSEAIIKDRNIHRDELRAAEKKVKDLEEDIAIIGHKQSVLEAQVWRMKQSRLKG